MTRARSMVSIHRSTLLDKQLSKTLKIISLQKSYKNKILQDYKTTVMWVAEVLVLLNGSETLRHLIMMLRGLELLKRRSGDKGEIAQAPIRSEILVYGRNFGFLVLMKQFIIVESNGRNIRVGWMETAS